MYILLQFNLVIPISFLLVVVFLLVMPLYAAPADTGMGLICVLSGIPVYLICVKWKNKPKVFQQYVSKYAAVCQSVCSSMGGPSSVCCPAYPSTSSVSSGRTNPRPSSSMSVSMLQCVSQCPAVWGGASSVCCQFSSTEHWNRMFSKSVGPFSVLYAEKKTEECSKRLCFYLQCEQRVSGRK